MSRFSTLLTAAIVLLFSSACSGGVSGLLPAANVNNVYAINVTSGTGTGAMLGNGGFLLTTFSGQTWYQLPVTLPLYNGPVYIDLGNVSVANNGSWGTSSLLNTVSNALTNGSNSGFTAAAVSEIKAELNNIAKNGTNASTPDCFAGGNWNGSTTA